MCSKPCSKYKAVTQLTDQYLRAVFLSKNLGTEAQSVNKNNSPGFQYFTKKFGEVGHHMSTSNLLNFHYYQVTFRHNFYNSKTPLFQHYLQASPVAQCIIILQHLPAIGEDIKIPAFQELYKQVRTAAEQQELKYQEIQAAMSTIPTTSETLQAIIPLILDKKTNKIVDKENYVSYDLKT